MSKAKKKGGIVFLRALRSAATRPPVWLTCWGLVMLLALVAASPWFSYFEKAISRHYEPGSLTAYLTEPFRQDHGDMGRLSARTGETGAVLALLAMLAGCFCAGGWLQVYLERTEGHSLRRFFFGGARFFWRFFRVLLMTLVLLGVGAWFVYGQPWEWLVEGIMLGISDREELASERQALNLQWTQHALFALWMGVLMVWGDYTRARIALHEVRSAVWNGLCTFFTLLRHPVRCLRPALFLFLIEWAFLWGIGSWVGAMNTGMSAETGVSTIWWMLILVQLAAMFRAIIRGAQLNAAVGVSRNVLPPLSRQDPWKHRVGGPGGPQYPIGGDDYGVSI